jgi:hypothetical protein
MADPVRPQGCEVANSVSLGVLRELSWLTGAMVKVESCRTQSR